VWLVGIVGAIVIGTGIANCRKDWQFLHKSLAGIPRTVAEKENTWTILSGGCPKTCTKMWQSFDPSVNLVKLYHPLSFLLVKPQLAPRFPPCCSRFGHPHNPRIGEQCADLFTRW